MVKLDCLLLNVKESGCMDFNQSVGKQNYVFIFNVQWLLRLSKFTRFVELILSQLLTQILVSKYRKEHFDFFPLLFP